MVSWKRWSCWGSAFLQKIINTFLLLPFPLLTVFFTHMQKHHHTYKITLSKAICIVYLPMQFIAIQNNTFDTIVSKNMLLGMKLFPSIVNLLNIVRLLSSYYYRYVSMDFKRRQCLWKKQACDHNEISLDKSFFFQCTINFNLTGFFRHCLT